MDGLITCCGWTADFEQLQFELIAALDQPGCGWTADFEQLQSDGNHAGAQLSCGWTADFEQLQLGTGVNHRRFVAAGLRILNSYN